jgi:hypothetical protein
MKNPLTKELILLNYIEITVETSPLTDFASVESLAERVPGLF